jgi:SAM-dependent methyltransferase
MSDPEVLRAQDRAHAQGHDYTKGSPHLSHAPLRLEIEQRLSRLVLDVVARTGGCRVLEVGAGHGTFTQTLLAAGATVTVTEASRASVQHLEREFAGEPRVRVVHDVRGEFLVDPGEQWDLAVLISVVHHIPDYLAFFGQLQGVIAEGGAIFSVQDPLWYPRRSRASHLASRGTYFAWRLGRGDYRRGLATRLRRVQGTYSDSAGSDLVEYHVVRQGVDEEAIRAVLSEQFDVEIFTYWSTQSPVWHRWLEQTRLRSDFGVEATGHRRSDG